MSRILCSVGSTTPWGGFAIPVAVWIAVEEWQALASWSRQMPRPAESPTLSDLFSTDLPRMQLEPAKLGPLREELAHLARDSVGGQAAAGLSHLEEFIRQAVAFVEASRKQGSPNRLTVTFFVPGVSPTDGVATSAGLGFTSEGRRGRGAYGKGRRY